MERSHREEGVEGKCRKDKGHDLWYRPGPLAELRQIPMRCLLYRSMWERSGSVVKRLTRDQGAAGSSLTGVTALCP